MLLPRLLLSLLPLLQRPTPPLPNQGGIPRIMASSLPQLTLAHPPSGPAPQGCARPFAKIARSVLWDSGQCFFFFPFKSRVYH